MFGSLRVRLAFVRWLHLAIVLGVGLAAFLFTTIPHGWWVFVTVVVISSGFQPGLLIKRSVDRAKGTLIGLTLVLPIIFLLQLNYRFVPLALICVSCAIWLPNARRYDLSTIFITLLVFIATSYSFTISLIEGPIEMVVNRGVCTIIGILICLCGDYFLFAKFNYSRKAYYLLQHEICIHMEEQVRRIQNAAQNGTNQFILIDQLRSSLNNRFSEIALSTQGMLHDIKISRAEKLKIAQFEKIIYSARKEIGAIHYCTLIINDPEYAQKHFTYFNNFLLEARQNFIDESTAKV